MNRKISCWEIQKITLSKHRLDKISLQKIAKFVYMGAILMVEIECTDTK